jgi:acetate kinase
VTDPSRALLVLNAGSSSVKFCTFRHSGAALERVLRGQVSIVGGGTRLVARTGTAVVADRALGEGPLRHADALASLLELVRGELAGDAIAGVGHRVVHGGLEFTAPTVVDAGVLARLERYVPLAPLHQPHNLAAIRLLVAELPGVPQVACFDTSFHRSVPEVAQRFALPARLTEAGVRRYGFHGLSYEYIASALPSVAPEIADGRVIVAHLGSGASLCAMKARKSMDSTLGFTALDGLCMGTRPGSLDPGVVLHLFQTMGLSAADVEKLLYKQSGLIGISGMSNDMRDLLTNPDPAARLAVDYFVYQAAKHIGALAAVLGGVDALVFTAGIGEHSAEIRRRICEASAWLGVSLDSGANAGHGPRISTPGSSISVWVVPTNEELMIARHTGALLGISGRRA